MPHYYTEWVSYWDKQDLQDVYEEIEHIAWGNITPTARQRAATAVWVRRSKDKLVAYKFMRDSLKKIWEVLREWGEEEYQVEEGENA